MAQSQSPLGSPPPPPPPLRRDSRILIVGSGVFGVSTALWLARAGYAAVTVLDMQDTASAGYDPGAGVDSASADINKIVRFSYGDAVDYQRLAARAAAEWQRWNEQIEDGAAAGGEGLPRAFAGAGGPVWVNCGALRQSKGRALTEFEMQTLKSMEREGIRDRQFRTDDEEDIARAKQRGWERKLDPCRRQQRFGYHKAVLDSTAGFVVAYKACDWARHLAHKLGVTFILDKEGGKAVDISQDERGATVRTVDGRTHRADLVVVAGGGWTPSLLPEVNDLLETTGGSVAMIQIPRSRKDLWDRYAPENYPVIMEPGIYSFPRDDNGIVKIGYRETKWTNYDNVGDRRISVPKTAHVTEKKETNIPMIALDGIKDYIARNLPDLQELGIAATKLCWYTDSVDNSFLVDFVPGRGGRVAVCSGGSGHGFKFLPILGQEVVRILEGQGSATPYGRLWGWRSAEGGAVEDAVGDARGKTRNGLGEGEAGPRVLAKLRMATPADWKFASGSGGGGGNGPARSSKL